MRGVPEPEPVVYGPVHRICGHNVSAPTVCVERIGPEGENALTLCVQWFGVAKDPLPPNAQIPEGSQFLFTVMAAIDRYPFDKNSPEDRMVVFLGQIKNWPKPEGIQMIIDALGGGSDSWIIWMIDPKHPSYDRGFKRPYSTCVNVAVLRDPICGVIVPQHFLDLAVNERAGQIFADIQAEETRQSIARHGGCY